MTPEQKELEAKFLPAIVAINVASMYLDERDDAPHIVGKLHEARDTLFELHEDWRRNLGEPVTIKPAVIARELRELANRLEMEDET